MEPILPEPVAQEGSQIVQEPQVTAGLNQVTAENAPNVSQEQSHESQPSQVQPVPQQNPLAQTVQPVTQVPDPVPVVPAPAPAVADPIMADDVDVIEKEWVDKAKHIVNTTKSDPYQQEQEVSKLQADYLQKRYNKTIKLAE